VNTKDALLKAVNPARQYLKGELPAPALVKIIDDLVSQNLLSELDPHAAALVDKLHVALALYVPDEVSRREEPAALIGPIDLLDRVKEFDAEVRRMGF
jgi:hypothetical protein